MSTSSPSQPRTEPGDGPTGVQRLIVAVLACAFLIWPYLWTAPARSGDAVGNELVGDGLRLVDQHPVLLECQESASALGDTLTTPWWGGLYDNQKLYRPLATFTLGLAGVAAGPYSQEDPGRAPVPYHFLALMLKVVCALLVLDLAWLLLQSRKAALAAGALFATLPVHGEVLFDVAGIAELLCTALSVAAWSAWIRAGRGEGSAIIPVVLVFLASLAKETAFVLPLVFFLTDVGLAREGGFGAGVKAALGRLSGLGACVAVLLASLALRWSVLGSIAPEWLPENRLDNPLIFEPFLTRSMNALRVLAASIPIMVGLNPLRGGWVGFSADYSFDQIPVLGAFAPLNLLGFAVVALLVAGSILLYRRCRVRASLVLVLLASMLLTSNLLFPVGTIFGERLLFFPSVAFVLFVAAFLGRAGTVGVATALLAAVGFGAWTHQRSGTWANEAILWDSTATHAAPNSARAHFNMGASLYQDDIDALAKNEFQRAVDIWPDFVIGHFALGQLYEKTREPLLAIEHYRRALEIQLAERGSVWTPDEPTTEVGPTFLLWHLTRLRVFDPAVDQAEEHLAWLDDLVAEGYESPALQQRRAETLARLGREDEAEEAYRRSLEISPTAPAMRAYGTFLRQRGRDDEALALYSRTLEGMTSVEQAEILIARGDAELLTDPSLALRTADQIKALSEREQLGMDQLFRANFLKAQAMLDLFDADPSAGPDRLKEIKLLLAGGLTFAGRSRSEEVQLAERTLAHVLFRQHDDETAIELLKGIVQQADAPTMRTMLAVVHRRRGQMDEALKQARKATETLGKTYNLRAEAIAEARLAGELPEDFDELDENDQLENSLFEARQLLLSLLRETGREDEARTAIDGWHVDAPGEFDRVTLFLHASWLAGGGDLEGAIAQAEQLVDSFPEEARGPVLLQNLRDMTELEQAAAAGTASPDQLEYLATMRLGFLDYDGARELAQRALEQATDPARRARRQQLLSIALEEAGDYGAALQAARDALSAEELPAPLRADWEKRAAMLEAIQQRLAG